MKKSSTDGSSLATIENQSKTSLKHFNDSVSVISCKSQRSARSRKRQNKTSEQSELDKLAKDSSSQLKLTRKRKSSKISDDLQTLVEVDDEPVGEQPKVDLKTRRKLIRRSLALITEESDAHQSTSSCSNYPCSKFLSLLHDDSKISRESLLVALESKSNLDLETLTKVIGKLNNPPFNDRVFEIQMKDIKKLLDVVFENSKESLHPIYRNDCMVCLKQWLMNGNNQCGIHHTTDDGKIAAHLFVRDNLVKHLTTQALEFKVLFKIDC